MFLSEAPELHSWDENLILMSDDISMGDVFKNELSHRELCHGSGPSLGGGEQGIGLQKSDSSLQPGMKPQLLSSLLRAERWLMPAPILVTCAGSRLRNRDVVGFLSL